MLGKRRVHIPIDPVGPDSPSLGAWSPQGMLAAALDAALHGREAPRVSLDAIVPIAAHDDATLDRVDDVTRPWHEPEAGMPDTHPASWSGLDGGLTALTASQGIGAGWHHALRDAPALAVRLATFVDRHPRLSGLEITQTWRTVAELPIVLRGIATAMDVWFRTFEDAWRKITDAEPADSYLAAFRPSWSSPEPTTPTTPPAHAPTPWQPTVDLATTAALAARHAWARGDSRAAVRHHLRAEAALDALINTFPRVTKCACELQAIGCAIEDAARLLIGGPTAPSRVLQAYAEVARSFTHRYQQSSAERRLLERYSYAGWWFSELEHARSYAGQGNLGPGGRPRTGADATLRLQTLIAQLVEHPWEPELADATMDIARACVDVCEQDGEARVLWEARRWELIVRRLARTHTGDPTNDDANGLADDLVRDLRQSGRSVTAERVEYYDAAYRFTRSTDERLERLWQLAVLLPVPPSGPEWEPLQPSWHRPADLNPAPRRGAFAPRPT